MWYELDVLDDMSHLSVTEKKPVTAQVKKTTTTVTSADDEDPAEPDLDELLGSDDFAKQLAAGMEQLMGQMGGESNDEMKEAFEKVWASFDNGAAAPDSAFAAKPTAAAAAASPASSSTREVPKVPQSFQDTIGKTMNKLKDSSKEIDVSFLLYAFKLGEWDPDHFDLVIHCRGIRRCFHGRINEANGIFSW